MGRMRWRAREPFDEMAHENRHIARPLPQRGHTEWDVGQAEEQVRAESAPLPLRARDRGASPPAPARPSGVPPSRPGVCTRPSSSTRSRRACTARSMSPISSSSSVPPLASSKRPARAVRASVKAPRAWPNSSASTSGVGNAAQLSLMKGRSRRRLCRWIWSGHQLLAGTALARDQDASLCRAHAGDLLAQGQHGRRRSEQLALRRPARPSRSWTRRSRRLRSSALRSD